MSQSDDVRPTHELIDLQALPETSTSSIPRQRERASREMPRLRDIHRRLDRARLPVPRLRPEFSAGLLRVPRAWGDDGEAMAEAAALALP